VEHGRGSKQSIPRKVQPQPRRWIRYRADTKPVGDEGSSEEDLMVELRVGVEDATRALGLMRRLSALFGRSAISFDRSRNEVRVESEWESRAVVHVFDALQAWIDEDGGKGATLSIGNREAIPLW
jgi:hypothetical protein